jgi:transglutaminase-like putative cysteine protease
MHYTVRHRTTFRYEQLVSISHHVLHLAPRSHQRQETLSAILDIDPLPTQSSSSLDYFDNPVNYLTIYEPHTVLTMEARSQVAVHEHEPLPLTAGPTWEEVTALLHAPRGAALDAYQYRFDSPYSGVAPGVRDFALTSFAPGRTMLDACMDLTSRIYNEFEYQGGVSDVSTPVSEVLRIRKGVCQDFAHLQIACLRSLGLPARYVSGYLLTHPPEGQKKMVGSDASHAWLSIWAGDLGWIDFDPTNNLRPNVEHITVAWGRDYGDVSPINGFIIGGGTHEIAVAVDVQPNVEAA